MTTIGDRMRELRCTLDPEDGTRPVSYRTIDRCVGAANRWARMEGRPDARQKPDTVRRTVRAVLSRLSVSAADAAAALAYVERGKGALPWSEEAPAKWIQPSPVERIGRELGTRVVGARTVRPGEEPPVPPRVDATGLIEGAVAAAERYARGAIDATGLRAIIRACVSGALASSGMFVLHGGDIWELLARGGL